MKLFRVALAIVLAASLPACDSPAPRQATAGPIAGSPIAGLMVSGNHLVDGDGRRVRLLGFNHSGAEYSCVEGDGLFDTPGGGVPSPAVINAMRSWPGANAVRVPLNEQCWLGLPSVPAAYAGETYRAAIHAFVTELNRQGFAAILDLHRSAPGDGVPRGQEQMPDRDHSLAFWSSVASSFRSEAVVFDLFNEPFPYQEHDSERAWTCWRDGGCTLTSTNSGKPYVAAGMNDLIAAIRATGSRTVVLAGGIGWAEGMTGWLKHRPDDPLRQVGASFHAYSFNEYCADVACYDRDLAPIAAQVPLVVGEIGPTLTIGPDADVDRNCPASAVRGNGFATSTFDWLDAHGASYTPWSWNPWSDCWSLVTSWGGELYTVEAGPVVGGTAAGTKTAADRGGCGGASKSNSMVGSSISVAATVAWSRPCGVRPPALLGAFSSTPLTLPSITSLSSVSALVT